MRRRRKSPAVTEEALARRGLYLAERGILDALERGLSHMYRNKSQLGVCVRSVDRQRVTMLLSGFERINADMLTRIVNAAQERVVRAGVKDTVAHEVLLDEVPYLQVLITLPRLVPGELVAVDHDTVAPSKPQPWVLGAGGQRPSAGVTAAARFVASTTEVPRSFGMVSRLISNFLGREAPSGSNGATAVDGSDAVPPVHVRKDRLHLDDFFEARDRDVIYKLITNVYNLQDYAPVLHTTYEMANESEDGAALVHCYILNFAGFGRLSGAEVTRLTQLHQAVQEVELVAPSHPGEEGAVRVYFKKFSAMAHETRKRQWEQKLSASEARSESSDNDSSGGEEGEMWRRGEGGSGKRSRF